MADYRAMKESLNTGMFYEAKDGENVIRVMTEPIKIFKVGPKSGWTKGTVRTYLLEKSVLVKEDEKSAPKFLTYVIDRSTGKLQLAEFGSMIMNQFIDLALSREYGFTDIPPYDLTLTKTGVKLTTEYKLMPARNNTPILPEEKAMLASAKPVIDILMEDDTVFDKDAYRASQALTEGDVVQASGSSTVNGKEVDLSSVPF